MRHQIETSWKDCRLQRLEVIGRLKVGLHCTCIKIILQVHKQNIPGFCRKKNINLLFVLSTDIRCRDCWWCSLLCNKVRRHGVGTVNYSMACSTRCGARQVVTFAGASYCYTVCAANAPDDMQDFLWHWLLFHQKFRTGFVKPSETTLPNQLDPNRFPSTAESGGRTT